MSASPASPACGRDDPGAAGSPRLLCPRHCNCRPERDHALSQDLMPRAATLGWPHLWASVWEPQRSAWEAQGDDL